MQCPRCQRESPDGQQFCGACGAPLAAACAGCGAVNPPAQPFCGQCGSPLARPSPASFASPEAYTPRHLAQKILSSRAALEGERKQVTVLFADLKGSMELLADRDPEEARRILDPVLELMMEAVHRYEGTVNQVMGDGIMALFGAPLALEDHALRACCAALRMQQAVHAHAGRPGTTMAMPLAIRVGVNSGEVVVRSIGSDLHMDYSAIGQTTHLAARMEQMARPGTVVLTASTAHLAEGYVEVRPLGPLSVKGLGQPVEACELLGVDPARTRLQAAAARGLTPLVGRTQELDALARAGAAARAGRGQVVGVLGEPGVGKSRLVWEFVHSSHTRGWTVLESRSVSYGRATTYLPVIDLLKTYFELQDRDDGLTVRDRIAARLRALDESLLPTLPAFLFLLGVPAGDPRWEDLEPRERRREMLEAIKRLLLRESRAEPLLLVVEDLHWIDSETQALLDSLVESIPASRLLLLVSYRPEYRHEWGSKTFYTQLRIDPLGAGGADELLEILLGGDAALHPLKRLLVERTEGNPLFLEECVRALVETGSLRGATSGYRLATPLPRLEVPGSIQAILAARIDRLAPADRALLHAAAVIGKDVPFAVLEAIAAAPEPALREGLVRLQAGEFLHEARLFPDLAYTFKHALTHEVAYGELLQERRRVLHAACVEAIEKLYPARLAEHAEALARHAVRGEVWDRAVDHLRAAGVKAYELGLFQPSLEHLEQARALLPRLSEAPEDCRRRIDVHLDLHYPLFVIGQIPRMIQLHEDARAMARQLGDRQRLGLVSYRLAVYAMLDARYPEGVEHAREVIGIAADTHDAELRVLGPYILGALHWPMGEFRTASDLLTGVVDGPDASLARRRLGVVYGSPYLAAACWAAASLTLAGDFERAVRYADSGVQAAEAAGHPVARGFAYSWRAYPPLWQGEFSRALSWAERAVEACESNGVLFWLPICYVMRGAALAMPGGGAEGLPDLERGATMWEAMGVKVALPYLLSSLADGLLVAGSLPAARRAASKALELALAFGERGNEADALRVLGAIASAEDPPDLEAARTFSERARDLAARLGMRPLLARCHLGLGHQHLRAGDVSQAREDLTVAVRLLGEMGMRFWLEEAEAALAGTR